jgi:hypothetical protein
MDVDGGAEGSSEVSGAAGDVAELLAMGKGGKLLNLGAGAGEAREDSADVGTRLHRNDAELILFVYPHEESLLVIVVDAATFGPVTVQAASLKEAISLLEQEVVLDELLLDGSVHAAESVVGTLEVTFEVAEGFGDSLLNFLALFASEAGAERELGEVAADANAGGLDHLGVFLGERRANKLGVVHVGDVTVGDLHLVVILNDGVEQVGESLVAVHGTGVAADARVSVLAARQDASLEGDTVGVLGFLVLVPDLFVEVLAEEGVLLAFGEGGVGLEVINTLEVGATNGVGDVRLRNGLDKFSAGSWLENLIVLLNGLLLLFFFSSSFF